MAPETKPTELLWADGYVGLEVAFFLPCYGGKGAAPGTSGKRRVERELRRNNLGEANQIVSITAHEINSEYRKAKSSIIDSANHIIECGRLLAQKKEELGRGNFDHWVITNCEFGRSAAYAMIKTSKSSSQLDDLTEESATAISRETWGNKAIATKFTGDHESYTPPEYIEAARAVMGEIDVDPASNDLAQQVVRARSYFTREDDGLAQSWGGCVFLNPPYEHPLIEQFIDKLIDGYLTGDIDQAVLLTNNSADTKWFHKAAQAAKTVCFTEGRINFLKQDGTTSSPTNGQAFFYFGERRQKFAATFSQFGLIVTVND